MFTNFSMFVRILRGLALAACAFGVSGQIYAESVVNFPSFQQFVRNSPHWDYKCDIQKFFANQKFRSAMGVTRVPTDVKFNAELAVTIPHVIYDSIIRLGRLNPEYAEQLFTNSLHLHLRFVCSQKAPTSREASTRAHFVMPIFWRIEIGAPTIDLGPLVLALIPNKKFITGWDSSDYLIDYNGDYKVARRWLDLLDLADQNQINPSSAAQQYLIGLEMRQFKITLFHEFLHADTLASKFFWHKPGFMESGGQTDVVYSCSEYTWRPRVPIKGPIRPTNIKELLADTQPYAVLSYSLRRYLNYFRAHRKKNVKIYTHYPRHPRQLLLHIFTYSKCMTCALARPYENSMFKATDAFSVEIAKKTCTKIAPKIDINFLKTAD